MKIIEILDKKAIIPNLKGETKVEVIEELVDKLVELGYVKNKDKIVQTILEREKIGSTGTGHGTAIPHGKSHSVKKLCVAFGRSLKGVDFSSLDGEPVYLIFILVSPEVTSTEKSDQYIKALAKIARLLKEKYFRLELKNARDAEEIYKIIREEDKKV